MKLLLTQITKVKPALTCVYSLDDVILGRGNSYKLVRERWRKRGGGERAKWGERER